MNKPAFNFKPLTVSNLVKTYDLATFIDLESLSDTLDNFEYNHERFNGAIVKLKQPKGTMLVFGNGKLVCCGVKSEDSADRCVIALCEMINIPKTTTSGKVVNIVGSAKLSRAIDLSSLARKFHSSIPYEPELYSAAVYRYSMTNNCKGLIFKSGNLIIVGNRTLHQLKQNFITLNNIIIGMDK